MKKTMLTSLTVLALVGGALAFKAKNFDLPVYCAASTGHTAGDGVCTVFPGSTFTTSLTPVSFCTVTNGTACNLGATAPTPNE